ncbi:MAG: hypothetical protein M1488_01905 [Gammaproteobacteria bacterium]|nr:hypothetical protein [Gammaproteobacteria bacterium]
MSEQQDIVAVTRRISAIRPESHEEFFAEPPGNSGKTLQHIVYLNLLESTKNAYEGQYQTFPLE